MTEQDATLLEQAATMLEELSTEQRNRGNDSAAAGADCSAHAVRRLAVSLLQPGQDRMPMAIPDHDLPALPKPEYVGPTSEKFGDQLFTAAQMHQHAMRVTKVILKRMFPR